MSAESCLPANHPSRPFKISRCYCGGWSSDRCDQPGWSQYEDSSFPESCGCTIFQKGTARKCHKDPEGYPQDLVARFDCCTGATVPWECDPRFCPGPSAIPACTAVFSEYCKTGDNINNQRCQRLAAGTAEQKTLYNEIAADYCIANNGDGSRFREAACSAFCKANAERCGPALRKVCASKAPTDVNWTSVCGCSYKDEVYTAWSDSINQRWNVPAGTFDGARVCSFPQCKSADLAFQTPPPAAGCPPTAVTTCLQNVTINAQGAAITDGDINVNLNPQCASQYKLKDGSTGSECTSRKDCGNGRDCVGGACVPAKTCTEAGAATDCPSGDECVGGACIPLRTRCTTDGECTTGNKVCEMTDGIGFCVPPPDDAPPVGDKSSKMLYLWIALAVLGAAMLIGLAWWAVRASNKKTKKTTATTTATATAIARKGSVVSPPVKAK